MEQQIIGSHNTMTYLPVKQWYLKPFYWTAKCQNKSLYQQFYYGNTRMFDIRVRFNKYGDITFAHGPIEYKGDVYQALDILNWCAEQIDEPVYCRVILESNKPMKDQYLQEEHFNYFCEYLAEDYPNIIFFGGKRKYDWKVIYDFEIEEPTIDDKYGSISGKIYKIFPWLYAKLNNKNNIRKGTNKDVLLMDFV